VVIICARIEQLVELSGTVSRPVHSFHDHLFGGGLQIVGPADRSHQIQEPGGQIAAVLSELSRLVVPRECVMVVVPSLPAGQHRNSGTLGRINIPETLACTIRYCFPSRLVLIVRTTTEDVGPTVHQERDVGAHGVTQHRGHEKRGFEAFVPEVPRYHRWEEKTDHGRKENVVVPGKDDEFGWISLKGSHFFWIMTTGSASKSLKSMLLYFSATLGRGSMNNHPT
jgi:hypothetical protein